MGLWSSSRGTWWKPTRTHITGSLRSSFSLAKSMIVFFVGHCGSALPVAYFSQPLPWVKVTSGVVSGCAS